MASSAANSDDIAIDHPYIKIYKDGRVQRLHSTPYLPPSLEDPATGVSWKDVPISLEVSARIYLPKIRQNQKEKLPILVYFHGAGFFLESAFCSFFHTHVKHFVAEANVVAVSVEFRLAPENKFPAAYEDCWTALQWVASHVDLDNSSLKNAIDKEPWIINHGDFDKLYLMGDGTGANVVHNMAIRAGKESLNGGVKILGGILYYPYFLIKTNTKFSDFMENSYKKNWSLSFPTAPGGNDNPMVNPLADDAPDLSGITCSRLLVSMVSDEARELTLLYIDALKKSGWKGELEVADLDGSYFEIFKPETEGAKDKIKRLASFINRD
nr:HID2 [Melodinus tenuicaudatus]